MSKRIQLSTVKPAYAKLLELHQLVQHTASEAGVDQALIELVKIRASQLNGCAFCTDMHSTEALRGGESQRRLLVLPVWWETDMFTDQERAALELTENLTRLSEHQELPDAVYDRATAAFTEEQYSIVVWAITVINAFNRLGVAGRKPLPA